MNLFSTFGDLLPTPGDLFIILDSHPRGFIPKDREFIPDLLIHLFSTLDLRGFELILTQNRLAKMNVFASELQNRLANSKSAEILNRLRHIKYEMFPKL